MRFKQVLSTLIRFCIVLRKINDRSDISKASMSKLRTSSAASTSACGGRPWRDSGTSSTSRPARRWARDQIPGKRFSYQVFRKFIWILEDSSFRIQNTYKSLKLSSCSCEQEEHIFSNRLSVGTLHSECGTIVHKYPSYFCNYENRWLVELETKVHMKVRL